MDRGAWWATVHGVRHDLATKLPYTVRHDLWLSQYIVIYIFSEMFRIRACGYNWIFYEEKFMKNSEKNIFFFFFLPHCMVCGMWDLSFLTKDRTWVPWSGREAQSLNHWTTREVPVFFCFNLAAVVVFIEVRLIYAGLCVSLLDMSASLGVGEARLHGKGQSPKPVLFLGNKTKRKKTPLKQ